LTREDCRGRLLPEDMPAIDAQFAQACAEQRHEQIAQFRIVRQDDKEIRWIETRSLISYEAGRPGRMVGIAIDVTDRTRAEAELKDSESRLADALAAGQVIAFEWDAGTRRSRRSANAAHILGYAQRGSDLDDASFFEQVHPDDRARFGACIRNLRADSPSYA